MCRVTLQLPRKLWGEVTHWACMLCLGVSDQVIRLPREIARGPHRQSAAIGSKENSRYSNVDVFMPVYSSHHRDSWHTLPTLMDRCLLSIPCGSGTTER